MKKKSKVLYNVTLLVIAVVLIFITYKNFTHDEKYRDIYGEAESLIAVEDYAGALELLESIKEEEYLDTLSLIELCAAHVEYQSGDFYSAYSRTLLLEWEYQSVEQMEKIEEFMHQLEMECVEFLEQELGKDQVGDKSKSVALTDIPNGYSLKDAKSDDCVTFEDGDITSGEDIWEKFIRQVDLKGSGIVRLAYYYTLDPENCSEEYYEAEKDNYPQLYIKELTYDGQDYTIRWFEDGEEYVFTYKYLMKYVDEGEENTLFESCTRYVLTNDETVTWEDLFRGMISSQLGDYIDHKEVYSDYIYRDE